MTAVAYLSPSGVFAARDNNGNPLIGGLLSTYQAGTATPIMTYTDATALFQNANPVVLNNRGEASVWLLPNIGYKYVLTDSTGNLIWTQDNIFLSQLLTTYGGVDSGVVNAYVLTFNANFTAYTDGIFLTWFPANSNTGPSTININGLGVINIVNPNGTALSSNSLIANQPAEILIKGGQAILLNSYGVVGTATSKYKAASTSRSSVTVLANDPDLTYAIPVAGVYVVKLVAQIFGSAGNAGISLNLNFSGSLSGSAPSSGGAYSTLNGVSAVQPGTVAGIKFAVTSSALAAASVVTSAGDYVVIDTVLVATSTGTLAMAWAQNTSNVNATFVNGGSYMTVTRIA